MKTLILACSLGSYLGCAPVRTVGLAPAVPIDPSKIVQPDLGPGCGSNPWTSPPDQGAPTSWSPLLRGSALLGALL